VRKVDLAEASCSNDRPGGCGDFYHVSVSSKAFRGMPLIKQHRLVQTILKEQILGFHGIQVIEPPRLIEPTHKIMLGQNEH